MANSSMVDLPIMMAFFCFNLATTSASKTGTYPFKTLLDAVVSIPLVEKLSLQKNGIPHNGLSISTSFKDEANSIAPTSSRISIALFLSSLARFIASNVNSRGVTSLLI